jgi:hypothetical protein
MNVVSMPAFAAMCLALALPARAEQVSVDFQSPIRPLTHAGSGFLHSFTTTTPADSLVVPLRPQLFRSYPESGNSGAFPTYDRAVAMGAKTQLVVSDAYGYDSSLPGDGGDWSSWEDLCQELVTHATLEGKTVQYDLWNEPDDDSFWSRSQEQWLETWKRGVQTIRAMDPNATIVGPSISSYDNSFLSMHDFLTFARDNNVLPNVISWHQFNGDFTANVNDLRAFTAAQGINVNRISLNEIVDQVDTTKPGVLPRYFAQIERNGIESAAHSCWDESPGVNSCFNDSLDGLLTSDTKQPRSTWWTYQRYGKMTGTSVSTVNSDTLDAVASRDTSGAYILLGRFDSPDAGNDAQLFLENLGSIADLIQNGKIHVLAERIVDSGLNPSLGPVTMINANFDVASGQLLISLPNFNTFDAYFVTLTLPLPGDYNGDGKVDAADYAVWRKTDKTQTGYNLWRSHFGQTAGGGAGVTVNTAVPEPSALVLLLLAAIGWSLLRGPAA